ncbi:MAG TPA: class I tRNA ligase family protein, partial [Streptosporangiaceae bacterium]|nr:class I tRNA ligase family protein [Streptosporangiaceae bacterium]
ADLLGEYGTDAIRYWSASARLGVDTTFDLAQLKIGRRLAIKVLNASRFVLGFDEVVGADGAVTQPLDRAMLIKLGGLIGRCTTAFDAYEHASALEFAEQFFWQFCDDYLELVKPRAYAADQDAAAAGSAITALRCALSVLLRLLAPVLPFVTEEVWSWWHEGSIHRASWPAVAELGIPAADGIDGQLDAAAAAIGAVRKAKSEARLAQKSEVARLIARGSRRDLALLSEVIGDVRAAGHVAEVEFVEADASQVEFTVIF